MPSIKCMGVLNLNMIFLGLLFISSEIIYYCEWNSTKWRFSYKDKSISLPPSLPPCLHAKLHRAVSCQRCTPISILKHTLTINFRLQHISHICFQGKVINGGGWVWVAWYVFSKWAQMENQQMALYLVLYVLHLNLKMFIIKKTVCCNTSYFPYDGIVYHRYHYATFS